MHQGSSSLRDNKVKLTLSDSLSDYTFVVIPKKKARDITFFLFKFRF